MEYRFLESPVHPETEQIVALYRETGWWDAEDDRQTDIVNSIVGGSHCFLAVFDAERLIAMGRAISDGTSDAYIQDVVVKASHRGKGIGGEVIRRIIERLHGDGIFWIGLIAERNSHPFYEHLGFSIMPDSTPLLLKGKP